jgi:hypothetical protein
LCCFLRRSAWRCSTRSSAARLSSAWRCPPRLPRGRSSPDPAQSTCSASPCEW